MKRWTTVFKALANVNRLKIIKMLGSGKSMFVTDIAAELKISVKSTSKHLIQLANLEVLESKGTAGHVFYTLNSNAPRDFDQVLKLIK